MRLAVICQQGTANAHYRAVLPMRELARRGHEVAWPGDPSFAMLRAGGVPLWDLLHVHQFLNPDDLVVARRLREHGVAVVWDTDDDLLRIPKGSVGHKRLGGRWKVRRHFERSVEMARAVHLMTTTSEHLAEVYREAGVEHVATIPNYLAPEDPDGARPRHQGVTIGCVAGDEHAADIRQLGIAGILRRVLRAHPHVRVVALGVDLKLDDPRYVHDPNVPFERLLGVERRFDVALAPLLDTPFNRSRSDVKLKEYAAAGAAWLASPVGPYVGLGPDQGGLLVEPGGWFEAIDALVRDPERRRALAKRGAAWARHQTIQHGVRAWEAAFRDAILRARREAGEDAGALSRSAPRARRGSARRAAGRR